MSYLHWMLWTFLGSNRLALSTGLVRSDLLPLPRAAELSIPKHSICKYIASLISANDLNDYLATPQTTKQLILILPTVASAMERLRLPMPKNQDVAILVMKLERPTLQYLGPLDEERAWNNVSVNIMENDWMPKGTRAVG